MIVAVLAAGLDVRPLGAQLLPLPILKPKKTATPTPSATAGNSRPDMVPEISDVTLQLGTTAAAGDVAEGCAESTSGVDLLRFSAASRNVGTADLVLGDPGCPSPCDQHPLEVCRNPDFVCSPAAGHNHAHYANYARYELLEAGGDVVVVGHKQGYCLRDTNCADPVYTCVEQGISAGCSDVYGYMLGCQYLDVTGIPAGNYLLRVTLDPLNLIPELSDGNNVATRAVTITRPGAPTPTRTATPPRTATPLRTVTPARTTTPAPTATRTATPTAGRTATAGATPLPPAPTPTAVPDGIDGALLSTCQRALLKAGRVLVGRTTAGLDDCVATVSSCEAPKRRTAACRERAATACAAGMERIAAGRAAFADYVIARCGAAELASAGGLAFERRRDDCRGEFDVDLADVATVADCVARQHVCRTGSLYETEEPRAGARLRQGGGAGGDTCIDDLGGPDPEAPALDDGRAIEACNRALHRAGRRFAGHRLASLQSCLAARASCLKSSVGREACERRAAATCQTRRDRLAADEERLASTIDRACAGLDFAILAAEAGANVGALRPTCAALGVPDLASLADYERCLARHHACAVDDLLRFQAPRALEWIGGWPSPGGACD